MEMDSVLLGSIEGPRELGTHLCEFVSDGVLLCLNRSRRSQRWSWSPFQMWSGGMHAS